MASSVNVRLVRILLFASMIFGTKGFAEVTLPKVLADHMVVQRDSPVHLWGNAAPGEKVSVEFRNNHAEDTADRDGHWSIYLPPGTAGGPFSLLVQGTNTIRIADVLVGDVWVASGQSNMEFPVGINPWYKSGVLNVDREIASANEPNLRLFRLDETYSALPQTDVSADAWAPATPASVADFSAVAFFFGRELVQKERVPIGLIEAAVGASPIEAWISLGALSKDSTLMPIFSVWSEEAEAQAKLDREQELEGRLRLPPSEQRESVNPGPEKRSRFIAEAYSKLYFAPSYLYNAMIAPLTPFPIRGVIWYQGEANAFTPMTAPLYSHMLPMMIADWRSKWDEGDFPFLYVQLANLELGADSQGWSMVREAQRRSLSVINTGMAVTIDVGDPSNIHPRDKQDVGHRLALWARATVYGEKIEDSGPLFRQANREGDHIVVRFDHAQDGLIARGPEIKAFEIAGEDGKFVSAVASIKGNCVWVSASSVKDPVYVRYGWSGNPECNLYNKEGLPASPFSSQE